MSRLLVQEMVPVSPVAKLLPMSQRSLSAGESEGNELSGDCDERGVSDAPGESMKWGDCGDCGCGS